VLGVTTRWIPSPSPALSSPAAVLERGCESDDSDGIFDVSATTGDDTGVGNLDSQFIVPVQLIRFSAMLKGGLSTLSLSLTSEDSDTVDV
jgi:hypothetical protein